MLMSKDGSPQSQGTIIARNTFLVGSLGGRRQMPGEKGNADIPRASRGWDAHNSHVDAARARWDEAVIIAADANQKGIMVTPEQVNRRITVWRQWQRGGINRDELRKLTGV